ncbi:MAG TPA: bifunctional salicylyl-CoA 5-hydroxylase/oxidoreductase [Longimicrobiales bacterium]
MRNLDVAIIGAGPAGLYLALLLRKNNPQHDITVYERNRPDDTFGWGVVFSDATLENLALADAETYRAITDNFAHWDDIDIHFRDRTITSSGHGFSGIARKKLLQILQDRARELGVRLVFQHEVTDDQLSEFAQSHDLVVGADGVNGRVRRRYQQHFRPDLDVRSARYIWLGTPLQLGAFTFIVINDERGVFQVHAYRFDRELSTFIVECDECSWRNAGFDRMNADETVAACERMFAPWLDGKPLLHNAAHQFAQPWQRFTRVRNEAWSHDNTVLIGDAAHTAHFSIGSGTKLAMEDAISLAGALSTRELPDALQAYQDERMTEALKLQNAARNSMEWFENVRRYVHLEPEQFAYSLLTRSQRVSHENLRLRDRHYLEGVERWFAAKADAPPPDESTAPPPAFTPYRLRGLTLHNRIVVSPMDMYSATDGIPNDFHLVHLGARALGGAALIFTEMTCVTAQGRISPADAGMYADEHVRSWRRITDFVHEWTPAKICLQLGHSGRKGSTQRMWEGMDEPLPEGNWEVIAPSALPYSPGSQVPRAMNRADMEAVLAAFVRATRMAVDAGFDMLELHCAHGYLLSSFITPLSNDRTDEFGGSLANRLRFPLEVFSAMRAQWPEERPMSVRISATDWVEGGVDGAEAVLIARAFINVGADIIHVSTGQTSKDSRPVYGRMFQTPFSDWIRNEARVPTIAVGNITEIDQVNAIIAAGRADLVALGRPHLSDPHWTLRAAAELGWRDQRWPPQYYTGKQQLERLLERARQNP